MGCCSKGEPSGHKCGGCGLQNSAFLVIVLYILLAIILGGILYY